MSFLAPFCALSPILSLPSISKKSNHLFPASETCKGFQKPCTGFVVSFLFSLLPATQISDFTTIGKGEQREKRLTYLI